ncbi:MAG TPA: glycosyltransferase family 2 protein [Bacteroidia bacterium]|jgi:glycosyltransferase involved in cell wall biosynthesis|nr:glycosyltransferase family 2 protein [Bacteroidia bacterium]
MLVSICIPTYNGGAYLEACLQSVCQQTYTDFEILICDDCSIDNTVEIVETFQKKDSRIKLIISEKNLGLVGNWNRCMELANGEWIKFVFQDDLILPTCLESMLQAVNRNSQMIVCEREYLFEESISTNIRNMYTKSPRLYKLLGDEKIKYVSVQCLSTLIKNYFPSNFIGEPTSIMIKKSVIDQIGLFNPKITQLCDIEYCLRVGIKYGFTYMPDKLVNFRVHEKSTTQKNNSEKYFTSVFGDRIGVLYLLLYDSIYIDFRRNCTIRELLKLKYSLFYVLYNADYYIKKEEKKTILLKEMQELKDRCPELRKFKKYYPLYATLKFLAYSAKLKVHTKKQD